MKKTSVLDVEQTRRDIQAFTAAVEATVKELYKEIDLMREEHNGQD